MADVRKQYTDEMHDNFGYFATWEPNSPIELGDIGTLKDNEFTYISNLGNLGIEFKTREDNKKGSLKYASKGGVSITSKANGATAQPSPIAAGFEIAFSREKAVVFEAVGTLTHYIDDLIKLKQEILSRFKDGTWEKDWVVVTHLIKADSATILISNNNNAKIDLAASLPTQTLSIASADAKLQVVASHGLNTEIIAQEGISPLFKAIQLKKKLFGGPNVDFRGTEGKTPQPENQTPVYEDWDMEELE